jgi:hypothetical protein
MNQPYSTLKKSLRIKPPLWSILIWKVWTKSMGASSSVSYLLISIAQIGPKAFILTCIIPVTRIKMSCSLNLWALVVLTWCLAVRKKSVYIDLISIPLADESLSSHTVSCFPIEARPRCSQDSNVNIESSRFESLVNDFKNFPEAKHIRRAPSPSLPGHSANWCSILRRTEL